MLNGLIVEQVVGIHIALVETHGKEVVVLVLIAAAGLGAHLGLVAKEVVDVVEHGDVEQSCCKVVGLVQIYGCSALESLFDGHHGRTLHLQQRLVVDEYEFYVFGD